MGALFITVAVDNSLRSDEKALLSDLPEYPSLEELSEEQHATCRRLEGKGLVKVRRWKDDPISVRRTWYAGRVSA